MSYIRVNNVGKAYRQYHSKTGRLIEWLSPFNTKRHNLKWILSDINFEVAPGEAVGIIGINGAGKSTLLKLITGTSRPTTGGIEISGRVAALLELGMGFHSDFTGRQNVYMSGQLLGLSSDKITELMPEIEEFAEIGDYIDQPVRVYSSGMQVRLAFSVATAIRPDVLSSMRRSPLAMLISSIKVSSVFANSARKEQRCCWYPMISRRSKASAIAPFC